MEYEWIKCWSSPLGDVSMTPVDGWQKNELLGLRLADRIVWAGAYQDERRASYPPLADQVDAQWKIERARLDGVEPPSDALEVMSAVVAVKEAIPKPPAPPWVRVL